MSGYYGYDNLGDEAILEVLISSLRGRFDREELEIVALSSNPGKTEETHDVHAAKRWDPVSLIRYMKKTDLLISGGGGLLQDRTSTLSLWYYLGIIYLARIFGVPVYVLGQGIGPIQKTYNKYLLSKTLSLIEAFLVRDKRSVKLLNSLGVEEGILKGSDLAFLLSRDEKSSRNCLPHSNRKIVAAALRDDVSGRTDVVRAVSSGLDMLYQKYEVSIILFSSHSPADRQINADLQSSTNAPCNIIDVGHLSPTQLVEMIKDVDVMIAGRLHTLIFSFMSGVPVQGISYDPKMDSLINEVNELGESVEFSLWHPEELINGTEYLEDLESMFEKTEELKTAASRVNRILTSQAEEKLNMALDWIEEEFESDRSKY
ncbi:MAG: polysaccharide pyruvyl transferase CsaB [Candidatus Bipolaricaulota bacterium]